MPPDLVDLDAAGALGSIVGAKAAALGRARRRGLPVLPGFVVPADDGRELVASLVASVRTAGPHAAALALMEAARAIDLGPAVRAAGRFGPRLAVRSSSVAEDDPAWAGAFTSFLDVQPDELPTAVAGCWASALTPAVLERCARTGARPADVCPAVLVQPMVEPQAGGIARVSADADVHVVGVRGSPAPLLAGWSTGDALPAAWVRAVADLARRAGEGAPVTVEWAIVDDAPVLLQVRRDGMEGPDRGQPRPPAAATLPEGAAASAVAPTLARAVARFGGPLGDELVLPWLLGCLSEDRAAVTRGAVVTRGAAERAGSRGPAGPAHSADPGGAGDLLGRFDRTVEAARSLVAEATGTAGAPASEVAAAAARLTGRVAAGDLDVLGRVRPVPEAERTRVLEGFDACGRGLRESGALAHEEQLWALSVEEVRSRLVRPEAAGWHAHRFRSLRWQPLVQASVGHWGRAVKGEAAAPGRAAGWCRRLASGADLRQVVPGDVVVLERPFPQAAPALWVASAVVAESGSPAAHLVDVARARRVPAVGGTGPLAVASAGSLMLVDGDGGDVRVLGP